MERLVLLRRRYKSMITNLCKSIDLQYYKKENGQESYEDNAFYLVHTNCELFACTSSLSNRVLVIRLKYISKQFTPTGFDALSGKKYPIMIEYHGGGFTGGQATHQVSREVQSYIDNGFFFASMNYRLVATKYFYKHQGQEFEEEFLHVNSTGHIWPDSSGKFIT